jgi:tetratricopeptide (TPR) repeat protein
LWEIEEKINIMADIHKNKDLTIEEVFKLAIENHQQNKLEEAVKLYNQVLKIDPGYANVHNNLGVIHKNLGENQKAITYYEKAIEIDPNYIGANYNLGIIFQESGENQKAKVYYEKVIEIDSSHADAYYNLGTVSLKLGEVENYNTYRIKFYKLKSAGIASNANLDNIIPKFVKKIKHQKGITTFFDNNVISQLTNKDASTADFCDIFEKGQLSIENRFVKYSERVKYLSKTNARDRLYDGIPFATSQGVHSLITWKEKPIFKTTFDLTIYSMILQEVKPDVIIELGSGSGGSAIWLADTAAALGLDTHVYSFDINKPLTKHKKVTFIEHDLNGINNRENKIPCWELFNGKKIIIEDAHVNLENILYLFDTILKKDDYLIIEDSVGSKKGIISNFMNEKESKYELDQFFLDFFGTNITCCINSIFKRT